MHPRILTQNPAPHSAHRVGSRVTHAGAVSSARADGAHASRRPNPARHPHISERISSRTTGFHPQTRAAVLLAPSGGGRTSDRLLRLTTCTAKIVDPRRTALRFSMAERRRTRLIEHCQGVEEGNTVGGGVRGQGARSAGAEESAICACSRCRRQALECGQGSRAVQRAGGGALQAAR